MSDPVYIENLRSRLRIIMDRKRVKPTTLSAKVGDSPTLVHDLMSKSKDAKLSTIYRLASALGVAPSDLISGDIDAISAGPNLWIKGEVAAGHWCEAIEWPQSDWMPLTGSTAIQADPAKRFFLRVRGDSMNLVYPEGSFIECVSVYDRVTIEPGKRVVVVRRREDQMLEATVKELVEIDGALWLVPRSTNPTHQAYRLDSPGEGIEEVVVLAVVVSSVRPE